LQTNVTISESKISMVYSKLVSSATSAANEVSELRTKLDHSELNRMSAERDMRDNEQLIASMKTTEAETLKKLDKSQLDFKELEGRCHDIEGDLHKVKLEVADKMIEEFRAAAKDPNVTAVEEMILSNDRRDAEETVEKLEALREEFKDFRRVSLENTTTLRNDLEASNRQLVEMKNVNRRILDENNVQEVKMQSARNDIADRDSTIKGLKKTNRSVVKCLDQQELVLNSTKEEVVRKEAKCRYLDKHCAILAEDLKDQRHR
jgi:chromosome segregation ATPase